MSLFAELFFWFMSDSRRHLSPTVNFYTVPWFTDSYSMDLFAHKPVCQVFFQNQYSLSGFISGQITFLDSSVDSVVAALRQARRFIYSHRIVSYHLHMPHQPLYWLFYCSVVGDLFGVDWLLSNPAWRNNPNILLVRSYLGNLDIQVPENNMIFKMPF